MRIFKGLLAGAGTTFLAIVFLYLVGILLVSLYAKRLRPDHEGGIGWDPISALTRPGFLLYLLLAFVAGFWFAYKH